MDEFSISRRDLVKTGLVAAAGTGPLLEWISTSKGAAATSAPTSQPAVGYDRFRGLKVGVATYTFRQKPLEPTIEGIRKVGVAYCSIKDFHLPLKSTAEQRKEVADRFRAAGITPLSCGNIAMRSEADVRQAFEYARDAGIPTIVCAPTYDALPLLEKYVKEFDLRIAIHNHGPEDKYFASPYDVWERVKDMDARVGLCVDVGHTVRAGVDPAEAIRKCAGRVYDCHMKDLAVKAPKSAVIEVGRGVLNIKEILVALLETKMTGHVGFEYEKDMSEPLPGLAESVGFVRGVLAGMPA